MVWKVQNSNKIVSDTSNTYKIEFKQDNESHLKMWSWSNKGNKKNELGQTQTQFETMVKAEVKNWVKWLNRKSEIQEFKL